VSATFTFIKESHTYLEDGRVVPSVTQVLERAGLVCYSHIPAAILDHKAEIGTAAHAACHYYDEGDLDESTIDTEVIGYLEGWKKFRRETDFTAELIEYRGVAEVDGMRYGYTLDRAGLLQKKNILLEIKCTAGIEISWGPQTAAYEMALRKPGEPVRRRVAVHLQPNGKYFLVPLNDVQDYMVFKWALGLELWKKRQGRTVGYGSPRTAA